MARRTLLGSRAAVGCTLFGATAVGAVVAAAWQVAVALAGSAAAADPRLLGGLGQLLFVVGLLVVTALVALVWYPFGAGIAYAAGRRARGDAPTLGETLRAVRNAAAPLARWLKTRLAVGPPAARVLSPADVGPNEVAAGCDVFVVPAVVLDSPTSLPQAVARANHVVPRPGRGRLAAGTLGATAALVFAVVLAGRFTLLPSASFVTPLAAGVAVLGIAVAAALDIAWRVRVYVEAPR